jgi:hypothetical protein
MADGIFYKATMDELSRIRHLAERKIKLPDGRIISRAFWDKYRRRFFWDHRQEWICVDDLGTAPVEIWKRIQ